MLSWKPNQYIENGWLWINPETNVIFFTTITFSSSTLDDNIVKMNYVHLGFQKIIRYHSYVFIANKEFQTF